MRCLSIVIFALVLFSLIPDCQVAPTFRSSASSNLTGKSSPAIRANSNLISLFYLQTLKRCFNKLGLRQFLFTLILWIIAK